MTATKRASGLLIHITSLPSDFGIGDLGPCSHRLADILFETKQHYWSILPLTPISTKYDNSPYQAISAFAGNTLLISPEQLAEDRLISKEYAETLKLPAGQVDFKAVTARKKAMLKTAYLNFSKSNTDVTSLQSRDAEKFYAENSMWLDDYALFKALREQNGKPWYMWQNQLRDREPAALTRKKSDLKTLIEQEKFAQYLFFRQWQSLKKYCTAKEISIIGDLPFYMAYDSADIWTHPELFKLNGQKHPEFVGGVPPDYFSKTGQYWGNPVYNWQTMEETDFNWWMNRIRHSLKLFNMLRLDHFRGFTAYWQIPASAKTARKGSWTEASPQKFFAKLKNSFPSLPFIAEDLGLITDDVRENLKRVGIPGMRVLLFAFDDSPDNPNLPLNHIKNSVVFTSTHDTNTVRDWYADELSDKQKKYVYKYLGKRVSEEQIASEMIKLALNSKAKLSIIPIQDMLALGSEARMNNPAKKRHNWRWRITSKQFSSGKIEEFGRIIKEFNRDGTL